MDTVRFYRPWEKTAKPGKIRNTNIAHLIKLGERKYQIIVFDDFVKSLETSSNVFPAEAEIQYFHIVLDACLRRHDGISDFLRVCQSLNA